MCVLQCVSLTLTPLLSERGKKTRRAILAKSLFKKIDVGENVQAEKFTVNKNNQVHKLTVNKNVQVQKLTVHENVN